MNTERMKQIGLSATLALLATLAFAGHAYAEDRGYLKTHAAHQHFDGRFSHDHIYFDRGYVMRTAPRGGYTLARGRDHFWYARGEWFRRGGRGWTVVDAPIGMFVPALPPFFTTVWFAGRPYYYSNDTYYVWDGAHQQYEVVTPPASNDSSGSTQPPPSDEVFAYPRNGQSQEQQARDRYECHRSAVEQTGYDQTRAGGGVPADMSAAKRADYLRAQAACLDARGYSVR